MGSEREDELLRQILANPHDLEVRSVYADLLQARSDPRGEFIALELAGDLNRSRALADRYAQTWWPEVPLRRLATKHGFIDRIMVGVHDVARTARVFASEPIRDLELGRLHPALFLPEHRLNVRPQRLWINGGCGASEWPLVLVDTRVVTELDLSNSLEATTPPLGTAFAQGRQLLLADNDHLGRNVRRLFEGWSALDRLEVLDLRSTGLVPELLAEVLALELPALQTLRLSRNPLGTNGAHVLARSIAKLPSLRHLDVLDCGFDPAALALVAAACGTRVRLAHEAPAVVMLDLVGSQLVLRRKRVGAWEVEVDGDKRAVRWTSLSSDDRPGHRTTQPWQTADVAPFDTLALAIASGARRELTETGCSITIGTETGYVYSTSVFSRESAEIDYELRGSTVSVTFRSYTSVD